MSYVIFGAGENALLVLQHLKSENKDILGVLDNDSEKWGLKIEETPVYSPTVLKEKPFKNAKVIISVSNKKAYSEIEHQLREMGLVQGRDFENGVASFSFGDIPGRVSGEIYLPDGFVARKTFDEASRLVFFGKENRLFRMVFAPHDVLYTEVLEKCQTSGLLGRFIVDTKRIDNRWGLDCSLLLEHPILTPITYSCEWTPKMFREYVLFMLDFLEQLAYASLALCDGHHMNATIHEGHFLFLDFGAIGSGVTPAVTMEEFLNMHIIPLILMERKQMDKGYACLKNSGIQYTIEDVQGYLSEKEIAAYRELIFSAGCIQEQKDVIRIVSICRDFLMRLGHSGEVTPWDGYQDDEWKKSEDGREQWSEKMIHVTSWLDRLRPDSILDIAGNMGWYGSYLRDKVQYAIIMDMDTKALDSVWERSRQDGYRNVLPVYMSVCTPTPASYRDNYIDTSLGVRPWLSGATKRLSVQMVLALAITHHLAFRWQMTFREIVEQIRVFSQMYCIVEFVEKEDIYIRSFKKKSFGWYTRENFEKELNASFFILEKATSTPSETRTLYLCKVKEKADEH